MAHSALKLLLMLPLVFAYWTKFLWVLTTDVWNFFEFWLTYDVCWRSWVCAYANLDRCECKSRLQWFRSRCPSNGVLCSRLSRGGAVTFREIRDTAGEPERGKITPGFLERGTQGRQIGSTIWLWMWHNSHLPDKVTNTRSFDQHCFNLDSTMIWLLHKWPGLIVLPWALSWAPIGALQDHKIQICTCLKLSLYLEE